MTEKNVIACPECGEKNLYLDVSGLYSFRIPVQKGKPSIDYSIHFHELLSPSIKYSSEDFGTAITLYIDEESEFKLGCPKCNKLFEFERREIRCKDVK